jgi:hypothetical protein
MRYVVRTWGDDERILLLDLYNEPGNPWIFTLEGTYFVDDIEHYEECAYELMQKVFAWARDEKPTRPLTVSAWHMPDPFMETVGVVPLAHRLDHVALELSDVASIHAYCDPIYLQHTLADIACFGKPILLTEWMARQVLSTYDTALPTLKQLKVGAYQWGLVKGKSQTYLPWPHVAHKYHDENTMWWHDVLDADGTFHDEYEGEVIRSYTLPEARSISGDALLSEIVSSEHLERSPSSRHLLGILQQEAGEHKDDSGGGGGGTIIPSVCSVSMAAINSMAAAVAAEQAEQEQSNAGDSQPTFGSHMVSPTIEGLDLSQGNIEF